MDKKVHVNVGTIGHIDHGKTTLTAAILAVQATMRVSPGRMWDACSVVSGMRPSIVVR